MFKPRTYRSWVKNNDLVSFEVIERQTDLYISASNDLTATAREAILNCRKDIEEYIARDPKFYTSLEPVGLLPPAPEIVNKMAEASKKAGVGPMASIAGAIAEYVGRRLLEITGQVIIENGGDIFIRTAGARTIGVYAGEDSPFTGKLALSVGPSENGLGICTSSGTVSHSLSFGKADAVTIVSDDTALSDAAATAAANIVKNKRDIEKAINLARSIPGINGILVIIGDKMGSWGDIKLI